MTSSDGLQDSTEVDVSHLPVFQRQGAEHPPEQDLFSLSGIKPLPNETVTPITTPGALASGAVAAAKGIATQDLPIIGRALSDPSGRQAAALSDYPELAAAAPTAPAPETGLLDLFQKNVAVGNYAADSGARENALADSVTKHISDIKESTGADIPNPAYGGFQEEATRQVLDRIKNGERIPYGVAYVEEVRKAAYQLFQNSLQDLASKHQSGSPDDQRMLAAINPALSAEGYADAFVKNAQIAADANYAKSSGYLLPWLASTVGEMVGSYRNPIQLLGLLAGPGELAATRALPRIAEAAFRQGGINVGLTGVQEPGFQERRAQLGEESGLVPALKDLGTSFLFGAVPGSLLQGIHEIFARVGPEAGPGVTEEFLRSQRVQDFLNEARAAPGGAEAEAGNAPLSQGQRIRKEIDDFLDQMEARDRAARGEAPPPPGAEPPPAPESPQPQPSPTGGGGGLAEAKLSFEDEPAAPTASQAAVLASTERRVAAARAKGAQWVPPSILDLPRTTDVTGAAIENAELDHATAPPLPPGVSPHDHLAAYEGMVQHQENPDHVAPPILPQPVPEAGPVAVPPDHAGGAGPTVGGAVRVTQGYEGPNPDAVQNRIEHLRAQSEDPSVPADRQREFRARAREFERYVRARDDDLAKAGVSPEQAASVRALRPGDVISGISPEGAPVTGEIKGWGRDGLPAVIDEEGIEVSVRPSSISTIRKGVREDVASRGTEPGDVHEYDGKPITYTRFDPRTLGTDAQAFQYKGGAGQAGVTARLAGVQRWEPLAAGNVVVYERADGKRFVVDGHQRQGLATRLLAQGHAPISFNGALLKEKDGWTIPDARAVAAKKNIQEGSGETLDTARVLRDRPDMWDQSLPTSSPKLKQAKGLAELSDEAWGMMVNGVVPENYASLVGQGVPDKTMQASVLDDIARAKPRNENEVRMIIADANALGAAREIQTDIFGTYEATRTYLAERAKVYSAVVKLLGDDKRVFSMLDREAERIEAAGNVLVDANADQASRAAQLAQILSALASRTGPVSAALNRSAESVANGAHVQVAARAFLKDIDRLIREEGLKLQIPPAISVPEPSPLDLDTPAGREMQTRELEADALARPAPGFEPERIWYQGVRTPEQGGPKREEPARSTFWTSSLSNARSYAGKGGFVRVAKESDFHPADRRRMEDYREMLGGASRAEVSLDHPVPNTTELEMEAPSANPASAPTHPVEVTARDMAENAKRALEASGTPADIIAHDFVTHQIEPLIDQAFPKVATEAGPEGTRQTLAPGVAPVTDADRLRAAAAKPMTGGAKALPEGGLFDETARAQPQLPGMSMAERWAAERQKILETVPHEAVLSKLVGECEI